jgi:hypothetical protein
MEHNLSHQRRTLQTGPYNFSPLKSQNFKIEAQENNEVCLFEEMTNSFTPSEKKPPLVTLKVS